MKLTITINMDNAAFGGEDEELYNGTEVARILGRLAKLMRSDNLRDGYRQPLIDINGNAVGEAEVTD